MLLRASLGRLPATVQGQAHPGRWHSAVSLLKPDGMSSPRGSHRSLPRKCHFCTLHWKSPPWQQSPSEPSVLPPPSLAPTFTLHLRWRAHSTQPAPTGREPLAGRDWRCGVTGAQLLWPLAWHGLFLPGRRRVCTACCVLPHPLVPAELLTKRRQICTVCKTRGLMSNSRETAVTARCAVVSLCPISPGPRLHACPFAGVVTYFLGLGL